MTFYRFSRLVAFWSQFVVALFCLWVVLGVYSCNHQAAKQLQGVSVLSAPPPGEFNTFSPDSQAVPSEAEKARARAALGIHR